MATAICCYFRNSEFFTSPSIVSSYEPWVIRRPYIPWTSLGHHKAIASVDWITYVKFIQIGFLRFRWPCIDPWLSVLTLLVCLWIFWCQDNYIFPAAIWPPIVLRPAFKAHGAIHFFCVLMSLTGNCDIALQTWIKSIRAKSLLFMWYKRISVGVYACFLRTTCGVSKHLVFALVKRFIFSLVVFEISSETCYFFALAQNPSRGKPVDTLGIFTPPSLWTGVENCKWGKITIGYWNQNFHIGSNIG